MKQYIGVTKIVQAEPKQLHRGIDINMKMGKMAEVTAACDDGYHVVCEDGYEFWSPKESFEKNFRPTDGMSFGLAIEAMKRGYRVARKGWNGKGIYLCVQVPDEHSKMTLPYIYIVTNGLITDNVHAPKGIVPWLASQTDMLADDWYIVE